VPAALADDTSVPSGSAFQWTTASGSPIQVTFEDLSDRSAVPDGGSSGVLLGAALLGLGGLGFVHKPFRRGLFQAVSKA
jgi:hypothetical protein